MPISRVVHKHLTSAGVKFIFSSPNVWYFWISISKIGNDACWLSSSPASSYNTNKRTLKIIKS